MATATHLLELVIINQMYIYSTPYVAPSSCDVWGCCGESQH